MAQYLSQTRIEGPIWLSPQDISFLRVKITEAEYRINLIEQQPSSPELKLQKDAKLGELSSFRNILSPIRRIPLEILSDIFEIHCPMSSVRNPGFPHLRDVVQYTTILSKVCVAWRNAVLATPKLLSRILIRHEKDDTFNAEASWIERWLPRSRGTALNMFFDIGFKSGHLRATELIENIIPFRTQIRSLAIHGFPMSFLPIFRLPSTSFPLLEELSLDILAHSQGDGKIEAFSGAPRLQCVKLTEDPFQVSVLESLVLPLEQLTVLKLDTWRMGDLAFHYIFDVLHRCNENLVSLDIVLEDDDFPAFTGPHLYLPRLKKLRLEEAGTKLLSFLTASPLLKELIVWADYDLRAEVSAFQQRSAATLTSLTVITYRHVDDVIGLLSVLPMLASLRLEIGTYVNDRLIFQALIYTEVSAVLPKLTSLEVVVGILHPLDLVIPVVLSRWWSDVDDDGRQLPERNGVCRLQKITLEGFNDEDISRLKSLSGLDVLLL
jgi:hypothetical protein